MKAGEIRKGWTHNEVATLTAILTSGGTYMDASNATGRSLAACKDKAWSLGLRASTRSPRGPNRGDAKPRYMGPTEERKCLCCTRTFQSEGNHNRLCLECRRKDGGFEDASMPGRLAL